jgi:GntR family transcriptional regulator, transcriptional repressor for pyruvate dehydrogenase complex
MEVKPVKKQIVSQNIINQLISMIADGKLKAGDTLPAERELAAKLNVSRPSLREAIRVMEIIGLVEIRPGYGSRVSDLNILPFLRTIFTLFSRQENLFRELFDLRILLEEKSAFLAAKANRDDKAVLLGPCIKSMRVAAENADINQMGVSDVTFHKALFELSGNSVLTLAGGAVNSVLEMLTNFTNIYDSRNHKLLFEEHNAIFEAVLAGDTDAALSHMKHHLESTMKFLIVEKNALFDN